MKCFRCDEQSPLFRVNAKGVPGVWACRAHRIERDRELEAIVGHLERYGLSPIAIDLGAVGGDQTARAVWRHCEACNGTGIDQPAGVYCLVCGGPGRYLVPE